MDVFHTAHWGWTWSSLEEDSKTPPISWTNWWPKLVDLIKGYVILNPLLRSHMSPFVSNVSVSHHLQLAQRLHCILAPVTTDTFITSWLDYRCVINLSMMPTALRKLQLIEKYGTHLHRHTGYLGSTKPQRLPMIFQFKLKFLLYFLWRNTWLIQYSIIPDWSSPPKERWRWLFYESM